MRRLGNSCLDERITSMVWVAPRALYGRKLEDAIDRFRHWKLQHGWREVGGVGMYYKPLHIASYMDSFN